MSVRNLDKLFSPRSVAVIGASQRPHSVGATVLRNLCDGGFTGPIYPVNPKYHALGTLPCWPRVASLPETPDLAILCTPPATIPGLIAELGERGTRAAIVLTAGLGVAHASGTTVRQAMLDAANPWLLRILGPNCIGLLVPRLGLNASFAPVDALPGKLAFVSQSGALVTGVLDWARTRGIGFSHFISLGESADVDFGDVLDYLAGDAHTQAILMYVEDIRHARKFMSAARAAARAKPTLVVKAGRAPEGARAAASHTGALAGSDAVYDAAIRRAGMLRVLTTEDLFNAVETLSRAHAFRGERLAVLTNGGGPGVMATDALIDARGQLATLSAATRAALDAVLPATWSHGNPIDIIGDAPVQRYVQTLEVLLRDPEVDAVLFLHAPTAIVPSAEIADAVLPLLRDGARPVLACWLGGDGVAQARARFAEAGIATFDTPEDAVQGFMQIVQYRRNQQLLMQVPPSVPHDAAMEAANHGLKGVNGAHEGNAADGRDAHAPSSDVRDAPGPKDDTALPDERDRDHARAAARALVQGAVRHARTQLSEPEAKQVLAAWDIPVVRTVIVGSAGDAATAAEAIGFPVAIKVLSPDITHKSDVGGVVLDLESAGAVREAAQAMQRRLRRALPEARLQGFSVQAMCRRPQALELIVGVASDPVFGPVILFGQGGVSVEVVADRAIALPPLNMVLARDLVSRTRVARLLAGYRHLPPADVDAVCAVLVRVAQLVVDVPEIMELDINPLLADSEGVIALDARMRLAPVPAGGSNRLAIRPYPAELEQTLPWENGTLTLRPIRPEDGEAHTTFFHSLTPEDVRMRMFTGMRELLPQQLMRFTQIDYDREMAFIATRTGGDGRPETLGVARAVADPDNEQAEFAVAVRSDLKGKGLGQLLMHKLIDYCRRRGTRALVGETLPDNKAMLNLASHLGFEIKSLPQEGAMFLQLVLNR